MYRVNYQVSIGGKTYTPSSQARVLSLNLHSALTIPIHEGAIALTDPDFAATLNAPVSVKLGYDDDLTLVFSGKISAIAHQPDQVHLECHSSFKALTQAHFNLLYEKSTAGKIVSDIAKSRLKLATSTVEDGIQFPVYVLGDNQTAYEHLSALAQQCGFDLYADAQDKLVFAKFQPDRTHTFQYGTHILNYDLQDHGEAIAGVEVYGESPASQGQGDQAYSWFAKKEVKGKAGQSSGMVERRIDPTARTQAIANKIAQAVLSRSTPQKRGWVKGLGNAAVLLGDRIKLSELPIAAQNGTFKITGVKQLLHPRQGFCTTVYWEEQP